MRVEEIPELLEKGSPPSSIPPHQPASQGALLENEVQGQGGRHSCDADCTTNGVHLRGRGEDRLLKFLCAGLLGSMWAQYVLSEGGKLREGESLDLHLHRCSGWETPYGRHKEWMLILAGCPATL